VTCYFRHLKDVFRKAGIEVTKENKQSIDQAIHRLVNVEYKNCSTTWKEIKRRLAAGEEEFILDLKVALAKPA